MKIFFFALFWVFIVDCSKDQAYSTDSSNFYPSTGEHLHWLGCNRKKIFDAAVEMYQMESSELSEAFDSLSKAISEDRNKFLPGAFVEFVMEIILKDSNFTNSKKPNENLRCLVSTLTTHQKLIIPTLIYLKSINLMDCLRILYLYDRSNYNFALSSGQISSVLRNDEFYSSTLQLAKNATFAVNRIKQSFPKCHNLAEELAFKIETEVKYTIYAATLSSFGKFEEKGNRYSQAKL
jgi:hypothetical protein